MRRRLGKVAVVAAVLVAIPLALYLAGQLRLNGQDEPKAQAVRSGSAAHPASDAHPGKPNRLIHEKSPYLLQHAYNPVDWYPWAEEAFEKAGKENKPIFLSVGYSTCHWCHVMERESFSNPEIAALMNEHFVSIKVDREERPDVDHVYMTFVQATTGRGGWPMSVFLTPDLKPFFGATYFPPDAFKDLLKKVAAEWKNNRERILASAGNVVEALKEFRNAAGDGNFQLEKELLDHTYAYYESTYDPNYGGFGGAPKFPRPVDFNFLLRYYHRSGKEKALEMTLHTLTEMAKGGIRDHIGGGFHRYSTDDRWFLPHFEKMLYDQAQLAVSYLEGFQLSKDPLFAEVAREIFDYILTRMTGQEGAFYSAEDADSPLPENPEEHGEGAFYVWGQQEIVTHLGPKDAALFNYYYGVKKEGNVSSDPFGEFKGKNILYAAHTVKETAEKFDKPIEEVERILTRSRQKLFEVRSGRPRPFLDNKVLTAWNGLMVSALARGYQVLREERYLKAAERAASFIAGRLYDEESRTLRRRYREGEVAVEGMIDDYAFFVQGLLDLYETSADDRWLNLALDLTETQIRLFWDEQNGGFYNTTGRDSSIILRLKEDYDGAEPSPNSIAVLNLLRLSHMAGNKRWAQMAEKSIQAFERRLTQSPEGMPQMMVALNFYLDKPKQILIAGERDAPDTQAILKEVHQRFIPNKIVVLADGGKAQQRLAENLEILNSLRRIEGKATAYICEDYVCKLPTNDVSVVTRLLEGKPGG